MTDPIPYTPVLEQHGYRNVAFGSPFWIQLALPAANDTIVIPDVGLYTQVYNFEVSNDADLGLILEPNNFYTQAESDLYFTLTLPTNLTSTDATRGYEFRTDPNHSLWTSSYFPLQVSDVDVQTIENPYAADSPIWVLNGSTYDLTFKLDFNAQYGNVRNANSMGRVVKNCKWNGRLILTFPNTLGTAWNINVPADYSRGFMQGQYAPFYTGWNNEPASKVALCGT